MVSITGVLEFEPKLTADQAFKIHSYIDYYYDDYDGEWIRDNKYILFTERTKYKSNMDTIDLSDHIAGLEEIISGFLKDWSVKVIGKLVYSATWNGIAVNDFLTLEVVDGKTVLSDERYRPEISLPLVITRYLQNKVTDLEKENSWLIV